MAACATSQLPATPIIGPTCVSLGRACQFPEQTLHQAAWHPRGEGVGGGSSEDSCSHHSSREISGLSAGHCNVGSENQKRGCDKQPPWPPGLPSAFWDHQVSVMAAVTDSFLVTNVPRDYSKS